MVKKKKVFPMDWRNLARALLDMMLIARSPPPHLFIHNQASEITSEATSLAETAHQEQEPSSEWSSQEKIQNAVLDRLTEPAERQEYLRFRAFQRYIREHGTEEAMNHWLDQQQSEKERIATQGLLAL
jgi:hypothetical protein